MPIAELRQQHEIEIRVRHQETDQMGLLHHANYFSYFELGLLRAAGRDYRRMEEEGHVTLATVDREGNVRRVPHWMKMKDE